MRVESALAALLAVGLAVSACDGDREAATPSTSLTAESTTSVPDPCTDEGAATEHLEVDLDGVAPPELVYLREMGSSRIFELGLCVDGVGDSATSIQADQVSVAGFVDLDDDGRKEVILGTVEEGRELTRAVTVTLRGVALTTLNAERWIDNGEGSGSLEPFTGRGVECSDQDQDGSIDLLVVDYRPADDLVHVDVAVVGLDRTTAVEVGVDSYETDVATAFDRWQTPLSCESGGGSGAGIRYGTNGWGRVDYRGVFESIGDLVLTAVAGDATTGRFVAVGYEQPNPLIGEYFPTRSTAWYSDNGVDWMRSSLEGDGELRDVVARPGGDGFVAVGQTDRGTAAVWASPDGEVWDLVEVDAVVAGGSARMLGVSQGRDGQLVAVGVETYPPATTGPGPDLDAAVWRSDDGEVWDRVESSALGAPGYQPNLEGEFNGETVAIDYSTDLGWVAVGSASRSGDDQTDFPTQYPSVWLSTDGISWQRQTLDVEARLRGVSVVGSSVLAYGESTLHGSPTADAVVLSSEDGMTWVEIQGDFGGLDPSDGVQGINHVVEVPGEALFAVGSDDVEFESRGAAAVWHASPDDLGRWIREPHDDSLFEKVTESPTAVMTDATWVHDELLVVGFTGRAMTLDSGATACCVFRPAVWLWTK